jgi:hypothetical protein
MTTPESRVPGACLCEQVRFTVELPTLFCAHCHCTMCQRNHGAAFVTWIGVPKDKLTVDAGEEVLVRYDSSEHGSRTFCSRCGTSLFCENTEHPEHVDIPLANMQGPIDREPKMHVFFSDRAGWQSSEDGLPRLGGSSGFEPVE